MILFVLVWNYFISLMIFLAGCVAISVYLMIAVIPVRWILPSVILASLLIGYLLTHLP